MQIINGLKNLPSFPKNAIVAMGNFDGIHLGHQKILNFLSQKAKNFNFIPVALTFFPHPEKILGNGRIKMIQTLNQRLEEIAKFNIQVALVLPFDKEFAKLSSENFIKKILVDTLQAEAIVVGEDFRFGKNREGGLATLCSLAPEFKFQVYSISSVSKGGITISSSLIRNLLQKGDMEKARVLLGKPYEIEGKVVKGKSRGKGIGFPTANIITKNEIIPPGVFITTAEVNTQMYPSLTNIGICPTFRQKETNIESFLINFHADLYGETIRIHFLKKIRDEIQFDSPAKLSNQIHNDLEQAKAFFHLL